VAVSHSIWLPVSNNSCNAYPHSAAQSHSRLCSTATRSSITSSARMQPRQEATRLGSVDIGTEHLLLGLLNEGNGVAAHVLMQHGVDLVELRTAILRRLEPASEPDPQPIGLSSLATHAFELSLPKPTV
jgi:ATP-dependent Clp protease ATP-binding subunit ClpA